MLQLKRDDLALFSQICRKEKVISVSWKEKGWVEKKKKRETGFGWSVGCVHYCVIHLNVTAYWKGKGHYRNGLVSIGDLFSKNFKLIFTIKVCWLSSFISYEVTKPKDFHNDFEFSAYQLLMSGFNDLWKTVHHFFSKGHFFYFWVEIFRLICIRNHNYEWCGQSMLLLYNVFSFYVSNLHSFEFLLIH